MPGLGWEPNLERYHTAAIAELVKPCAPVSDEELPDTVDPGESLPINDQGQRKSCCGNAVDKALERDHQIETGKVVNLSARFSYLAARIMDGTNDDPDSGASISGGALGSKNYGTVLEKDFPYWGESGDFDPSIPQTVFDLAKPHGVQSVTPLQDVDAIIRFVGSGQGAVVFGIMWTELLMYYRGGDPVSKYTSRGIVGGHALCVPGYVTYKGVKCPKVWNSHGVRWGSKGTMVVLPDVFQKMLESAPFGAMGVSGLPIFTRRKIDMIMDLA